MTFLNVVRKMIRIMLVLILGIITGFVLLCLVHMLPTERMNQNAILSSDAVDYLSHSIPGYKSTYLDKYTDSIMINQAICPVDAPLIERVIFNYQANYFKQYSQQENLSRYLSGEEGYGYVGYAHYWGGYLIFLKPLLMVFDIADLLSINTIVQGILFIYIIMSMCQKGKRQLVIPFGVAIMSIMPITIAHCFQYSDIFYITLVGTLIIIKYKEKIADENMLYVFLLLGMSTSYFDFLTYPFVSLGIPLTVFLFELRDSSFIKRSLYVIECSAAWCIGYLGMWAGKWILGTLLLPEANSLSEALRAIAYRGSDKASDGIVSIFDVSLANMFVYLKWPTLIMLLVAMVYLLCHISFKKRNMKSILLQALPYLFICCYPFAWYFISKNHSYEHTFMAYRELAIATFAGLCFLAQLSKETKQEPV